MVIRFGIAIIAGMMAIASAQAQERTPPVPDAIPAGPRWVFLGGDDFISAYAFRLLPPRKDGNQLVLIASYYSRPLDDDGHILSSDIIYAVDCAQRIATAKTYLFYDSQRMLWQMNQPIDDADTKWGDGEFRKGFDFICDKGEYPLVSDPLADSRERFAAVPAN